MTISSSTNDEMLDDLTPPKETITLQGLADRWPRTWYWVDAAAPVALLVGVVALMMFPGPHHPMLEVWERVTSVCIILVIVLATYWGRLSENDPRPRIALRQVARLVYGDYNTEVLPGLVISREGAIQARVFVGGPWLTNPGRILGIEIVPIICPGFPVPSKSVPSGDPLGHHRAHDDWERAGGEDWPTTHNLRDLPAPVERGSAQTGRVGSTGRDAGGSDEPLLTLTQRMTTHRHAILAHPDGTPVPMRRPGDIDLAAREIGLGRGAAAEQLEEDDLVAELLEAFDQEPAPTGRTRSSGVGRLLQDLLSMDRAGEFTIVPRPAPDADDQDVGDQEDEPSLRAHVPTRPGVALGDPLVRGMGPPEDRPTVRARRGHLELLD